ncbi:MAG: hypothetical protein K5821_06960 [Nitrobacter sp.]|uniref:hypothetical protein n=1 Tax=Nitrobacter sp. TaxID=29420 RepID=UPI00261A6DC1|nr:hypothetical protein [Nitrobacter sp.]MCV0386158.1 hypothetical protein [Nitrobacter sp.]
MSSTINSDSSRDPEFPAVLAADLWGDEIPAGEHAAWLAMTLEKREIALRRSAAIASVLSSSASASEAALEAEVSLPRFYSLLRAWKRSRSLGAIVPHTKSRGRNRTQTPPEVESLAREFVSDHPSLTHEALAKAIVERLPGVVSLSKARRVVAKEKVRRNRLDLGGANGFGRQLLIDRSALGLEIRRADGVLDYAVFAAVADVATGYIIGHAVGTTQAGGAGLQLDATSMAITNLLAEPTPPESVLAMSVDRVVVALDSENPLERLEEAKRIYQLGGEFEPVISPGTRPVGIRLNRLISGRLGGLKLRPSSTFATLNKRLPEDNGETAPGLSLHDAMEVVRVAVVKHNEQIARSERSPVNDVDLIVARLRLLVHVWS